MLKWLRNRFQGPSAQDSILCPWDGHSIVAQRTHRAAKTYECVICGAVITKGDEYARTTYVVEKKLTEAISCRLCGAERTPENVEAGVVA
jgi:hypothetical protein